MFDLFEEIEQAIKDILMGFVESNLTTMFTDVNDKTATIATEVGQTPQGWNSGIFNMVQNLSESVVIPIAGLIITFVLCYELITMITEKNNTFDIVMAVFDVGQHLVTSAAGVIGRDTNIDVDSTLQQMRLSMATMDVGELLQLTIETMLISMCMKIMSILITVIMYGRMIEIYLYTSIAPVPFATMTNREWGSIGTNYARGLLALGFQGFFIIVCVGIYAVLVNSMTIAANVHSALFSIAAYTVILCFALFKTGGLAKQVFNAH